MNAPELPEGYRFVVVNVEDYVVGFETVVRLEKLTTVKRFLRKPVDEWVKVYSLNVSHRFQDTPVTRVYDTMMLLKKITARDIEYETLAGEYPPRTEL